MENCYNPTKVFGQQAKFGQNLWHNGLELGCSPPHFLPKNSWRSTQNKTTNFTCSLIFSIKHQNPLATIRMSLNSYRIFKCNTHIMESFLNSCIISIFIKFCSLIIKIDNKYFNCCVYNVTIWVSRAAILKGKQNPHSYSIELPAVFKVCKWNNHGGNLFTFYQFQINQKSFSFIIPWTIMKFDGSLETQNTTELTHLR